MVRLNPLSRRTVPVDCQLLCHPTLRFTGTLGEREGFLSTVTPPRSYAPTLDLIERFLTTVDWPAALLYGSPGPWLNKEGS
jgi:hypothetical protein